jgi:hypothetical protein
MAFWGAKARKLAREFLANQRTSGGHRSPGKPARCCLLGTRRSSCTPLCVMKNQALSETGLGSPSGSSCRGDRFGEYGTCSLTGELTKSSAGKSARSPNNKETKCLQAA